MTSYVALLRGINLASNRRVAMADFRDWLADLGYTEVRTHLQSGNAVLQSGKRPATVAGEIEKRLSRETGHEICCVIRTADELRKVVGADPFRGVATNPSRYLVSFLAGAVDRSWLADLDPAEYEPERFHVGDREVYFWCPNGLRGARLPSEFDRRSKPAVATARNWNTVTKLLAMCDG